MPKARISLTLKYAILCAMRKPSDVWIKWAETFSRFKVEGLVIWLLEAGEPLMLVGAQMLHFGQPLIGSDRVTDLAYFLENKEETRAFAAFLKKD